MTEYGFIEGKDFCSKMSESTGGRPAKDFDITVDMAKQICMIQRSEKGRQYRQYFLDLEKAWNTPEQVFARALKMADKTIEKLKEENSVLLEDNQRMRPKEEYFDALVDRKLLTNFRTTAKEFGMKEGEFITWLLEHGYVYRDQKNKLNPYAKEVEQGLFEIKEYTARYSGHSGTQTLITPKGREIFRMLAVEM